MHAFGDEINNLGNNNNNNKKHKRGMMMKIENKRRRPKANYLCQLRIANYGIDVSLLSIQTNVC